MAETEDWVDYDNILELADLLCLSRHAVDRKFKEATYDSDTDSSTAKICGFVVVKHHTHVPKSYSAMIDPDSGIVPSGWHPSTLIRGGSDTKPGVSVEALEGIRVFRRKGQLWERVLTEGLETWDSEFGPLLSIGDALSLLSGIETDASQLVRCHMTIYRKDLELLVESLEEIAIEEKRVERNRNAPTPEDLVRPIKRARERASKDILEALEGIRQAIENNTRAVHHLSFQTQSRSKRDALLHLVIWYANENGKLLNVVWNELYGEFRAKHKIDLLARSVKESKPGCPRVTGVDVAESLGKLDDLYSVALNIFAL